MGRTWWLEKAKYLPYSWEQVYKHMDTHNAKKDIQDQKEPKSMIGMLFLLQLFWQTCPTFLSMSIIALALYWLIRNKKNGRIFNKSYDTIGRKPEKVYYLLELLEDRMIDRGTYLKGCKLPFSWLATQFLVWITRNAVCISLLSFVLWRSCISSLVIVLLHFGTLAVIRPFE